MLVNGCKHALGTGDLDRPGKTWTRNGIHPVTANTPPQRGPLWGRPSLPAPGLQQLTDILSHVRWKGSRLWLIWRTPGMARSIAKKKHTPKKPHHPANRLSHATAAQPSNYSTQWIQLDDIGCIQLHYQIGSLRKLDSQIANQYINRFNRFNRFKRMFLVTDGNWLRTCLSDDHEHELEGFCLGLLPTKSSSCSLWFIMKAWKSWDKLNKHG